MESPSAKTPLVQPSWLRVVTFVFTYLAVILFSMRMLNQSSSSFETFADWIGRFSGNPNREFNFVLLTLLGSFLLSVILVTVFRQFVDRQSVSSMGFQYRKHVPDAVVGCLLPVIILGGASLVLYFNGNLDWTDLTFSTGDLLNALFVTIAIAVGEEMVFRGYILSNLMLSMNRWLALFISAALFAFMHSANPGVNVLAMINLFVGGLLLGINYIFTRNLWFSIFLHTAWNFLQGPVLGFPVSGVDFPSVLHPELRGDVLMTGGTFGLEGSVLTGVLLIITILVLYVVYQSRIHKPLPSV